MIIEYIVSIDNVFSYFLQLKMCKMNIIISSKRDP